MRSLTGPVHLGGVLRGERGLLPGERVKELRVDAGERFFKVLGGENDEGLRTLSKLRSLRSSLLIFRCGVFTLSASFCRDQRRLAVGGVAERSNEAILRRR